MVEPTVRDVTLDGVRIPTPKNPVLPKGLRGVVVKLAGRDLMGHGEIPAFEATKASTTRHPLPLAIELPSHFLGGYHPFERGGVCELASAALGLPEKAKMESQTVVTALDSHPELAVGNSFTTCADVKYFVNKFPLTEGALLYGNGQGRPPALPGMRAPSDRALADAWLTEKIKEIHEQARGVYGSHRVQAELRPKRGVPHDMVLEVVGWVGVTMIAGSLPFQIYALYAKRRQHRTRPLNR